MAETHVVSALVKKRSEVSGEIKHYENLLKKAKTSLQSIDQTIHLFDENYDLRIVSLKVRNFQTLRIPKLHFAATPHA
ncbi:MAG TPA: hypothetical protein ENK98_04290 [Epsilonproteobacteria bacterium]|nr:hypothetical protein [Campylobacterota bacterium]